MAQVLVSVARSPLRMLAYAALAVPMVLLAIDMLAAYRWFPPPDTYDQVIGTTIGDQGQSIDVVQKRLTVDGRAQRRRDLLVGSVLLVGGVGAAGFGMRELVRPRALLTADEQGLTLRIDGPGRPARFFGWDDVAEVTSGIRQHEGHGVPVLSVRLHDLTAVPSSPAGGEAAPPWLHLYSDEWDIPGPQVAMMLDRWATPTRGGAGA